MKKYCYAYFNKLGDFFGTPFFVENEKKGDFVKLLGQVLFSSKQDELEALKEDDLYFIGTFDNETGVFEPSKEFVTSMSGMAAAILNKKFGGSEDGKQA